MIKLEHVVLASPEQMEFIVEGMRNPMNSWEKSDSWAGHEYMGAGNEYFKLGNNDHSLMQKLSKAGTDHRKYMRMMPVYVRITAPLYWWKEFDTYKVGTVSNSCSTMHKIQAKRFDRDDFSIDYIHNTREEHWMVQMDNIIGSLNVARERYLETKDKIYWWQMIQLLPSSYNQTRNVMMNYEVLANIYKSRKDHKLDEWRDFCKWIESLQYSELIIGFKEYDTVGYGKAQTEFVEKMNKIAAELELSINEVDAYCNNCEHFHICLDKGGLVDVATGDDITKGHYINKPGYDCPKKIKVDNTKWAVLYQHGDED